MEMNDSWAESGKTASLDEHVYERLMRERILVLGTEVRDDVANLLSAQMLLLSAAAPEKDIWLYVNSPGGSVTAGLAIYDTMRYVRCDVATVAMGLAASMGQFLLSAGTRGKRYALPHARVVMHQPLGGFAGVATDIGTQAVQMIQLKHQLAELIAEHTGQPLDRIVADSDRDSWFTADEAKDYGFVDHVIESVAALPAA